MADLDDLKAHGPVWSVKDQSNVTKYFPTDLPIPCAYSYELDDVSEPDAGRVENGYMYKKRIGQVFAVELEWWGITSAEVSAIMQAFDDEYLTVKLWNAKTGTWATTEMYVGNRTAPMYSATLNIWSNLKFKLIKRAC